MKFESLKYNPNPNLLFAQTSNAKSNYQMSKIKILGALIKKTGLNNLEKLLESNYQMSKIKILGALIKKHMIE